MHRLRILAAAVLVAGTPVLAFPQARNPAAADGGNAPARHDIRILRSDARGVVFEYRPLHAPVRSIAGDGEAFSLYDFENSVSLPPPGREGTPDLRYRSVPLALASESAPGIRILANDYEDISATVCAPVPTLGMRDGMLEVREYAPDRDAYAAAGLQPSEIAVAGPIGRSRSVTLGSIHVYPVQFNASTQTIRRHTRIVVEVTYTGSGVRPEESDVRLFGDAVINRDAFTLWTRPVARTAVQAEPSVLASGDWFRIVVKDDGIYRLNAAALTAAGVPVSSLNPTTIRVFGNGGAELSEDPTASRPVDLTEIAVHVEGEADGRFDAGDYLLFYGRGVRGWRYDTAGRTIRHYINRYTEENVYWLTFGGAGGKRMEQLPSEAGSPSHVAESTLDGVFVEEEKVNLLRSGKDWLGQTLPGSGSSFTHMNTLNGSIPGSTVRYRYALASHSTAAATFTVRESGSTIGIHALPPTFSQYQYATGATFDVIATPVLTNNQSQVNFTYTSNAVGAEGYIDWLEVVYPRMLWAVDGHLQFRSPDTTGLVEFRLQYFETEPWVFDVTDHAAVRRVTGLSGSYVFRAVQTVGQPSLFCAAVPAAWKSPVSIQKAANQNLRGIGEGYDFIIVTSREFRTSADRLKAFREQPANGGLRVLVADVDQIYNEFGGGLPDITAIRDFLKFAYDTWTPRPTFVLFLGWASYDYKGLLGTRSSYVPTWQSLESKNDVDSYATDDFFVKFARSDLPSMVTGRLSARSASEAEIQVDKIIRYAASSARDTWKTRILYIGDDAWTPEGGEIGDRTLHSDDTERLAGSSITPDEFEKRKIYLAEYPTQFTAGGRRKPGVFASIIDQVNQGALIVNYAGHGNPNVWAHERVFEVSASIPQLVNNDRLAVFFLATCNFSQYDDPKAYTGGEVIFNKRDGGAVGVVSATRKVYAGANAALNQGTYRQMFKRDAFGRVVVERPATALFLYKSISGNFQNDQKFFYFGDPTMRLQYPSGYASIDSINGEPVDSVNGSPRTNPIQLRSLSKVKVQGTVRDAEDRIDESVSGTMSLVVNDASRKQTIVNFYPGRNWDYLATGGTVFRGLHSVSAGRFAAEFLIPKDVAYGDSTALARMTAYISNPVADGAGYTGKVRIGGTDTTAGVDVRGPEIDIYLENRSFRAGDVVPPDPVLLVDFRDSSGINTSGSGVGHRIEGWVNNSVQSIDLTEKYTSALDNFREGTVQYDLSGLPAGRNSIRIRAWDSYNNSAMVETYFDVAASEGLTIADVMNYPNPFSDNTQFTFRQSNAGPLSVTVRIYTLAGRAIQTLETVTNGELYVSLPWDGRDRDGDRIANGVYLYKVIARTVDGRATSEALGKLAIVR